MLAMTAALSKSDEIERWHAARLADRSGPIDAPSAILRFMLAGNATFTLVSKKSGTRFTFRVRDGGDTGPRHFVSMLNGPSNEDDFAFLGTIFRMSDYRHGKKSRIDVAAPSARAFAWFFGNLVRGYVSPTVEFWHEGKCGRCGRKLTVPESVSTGFGPECATRV